MAKQVSISEAKNKLTSIVHYVEKGPHIELTRRGKPVAILLSAHEYERLKRRYGRFWVALSQLRQTIKDEQIEITDEDFQGLRDRSTGRQVKL